MSNKWKIFRFFNYVQLLFGLYFSYNILNNLINNQFRVSPALVFLLVILFGFTIVANSIKNIYLLRYLNLDRTIPKTAIQFHTIVTLLFCLYLIGVTLLLLTNSIEYGLSFIIFLTFLITGIIVGARQINLVSAIREAQEHRLRELISSIGSGTDTPD